MKQVIVGLGEALWDCLPEGKKLGGAPANFAYHAGQFGVDSMAISAVGNDTLGEETLKEFDQKGVHYLMPHVDYPTGTVQVTLDSEGIPTYDIKEGVAWDNIPFTPEMEEIAKNCRAICFGSLAQRNEVSRQTIHKFLDTAPKDCLKIFDINLRQNFYSKEVIQDSLRSYVFAPGVKSFLETPHVKVADTVGAGDSFTGSFAAAILAGMPIPEAHRLAVDVSAYVCTQQGAMPKLPEELLSRIR